MDQQGAGTSGWTAGTRALAPLRHPVVAAGLGLVALQLLFRAWWVVPSWFYTDDYVLLLDAHEQGLTAAYLGTPYNGHVMPGSRLLLWAVEASGTLNWGAAATVTLVLQALAGVAALWMLVTLFGSRWAVLAPLALYLTAASTAQATMWWISSVNQIPVQLAFFLAVGAWVRYLRGRRAAWLAATAAAIAFGLLFFQKTLLVLPVLVFVMLAYFATGSLWARVVQVVRAYWPAAVVVGGLAGAYTAYYLLDVEQVPSEGRRLDLLSLTGNMTGLLVSSALGGPWGWDWRPGGAWADTPPVLQAAAWVVAATVVAYSVVRRRWAWPAWLLLAGYAAAGVVLVATSRAPVFGSDIGLAYRLQTDALCAVVLCLGLAFLPVRGATCPSTPREPSRLPSVPPAAVVAVVAVVCVSATANWWGFASLWHRNSSGESYVRTLGRELEGRGAVVLADRAVPNRVLPAGFFAPRNRVSTLTPLLGSDATFPDATPRLNVVAPDGTLHQALVDPAVRSRKGPQENCGWLVRSPGASIPLRGSTLDLDWWVRIGYLANKDDEVRVTAGDRSGTVRIQRNLGSIYLRAGGEFDSVRISGLDPGTRMCVDVVEVGRVVEGPSS